MLAAGDLLCRCSGEQATVNCAPLASGLTGLGVRSALALIRIGSNGGDVKLVLRDFGGPRSGY